MNVLARGVMTLGEWVQQEMARRNIKSNRKFAESAGVSPQMINDVVNETPRELDITSLVKLSNYTNTSLMSLIRLAFPEAVKVDLDIEYLLDAEMMSKLPPEKKAIARGYIASAYAEGDDQ